MKELCPPAPPNLLGYFEWGFTQVLHDGGPPGGLVSVATPPGPPGVPPPALPGAGGAWPPAPQAGPTSWQGAAGAPADAQNDYDDTYGG